MSRLLEIRAAPLRALIGLRSSLAATMLARVVARPRYGDPARDQTSKLRTAAQRLGGYLLRQVEQVPDNQAAFRLPIQKRLLAGQYRLSSGKSLARLGLLREDGGRDPRWPES